MSLDDEPPGPGSTREDGSLSCSDLVCCQQQRNIRTRFGLHSATQDGYGLKMHAYIGTNMLVDFNVFVVLQFPPVTKAHS